MEAGDIVMVVESDKADMDVEAFESGYLAKILVPEGSSGVVGAPVAYIVQARSLSPLARQKTCQNHSRTVPFLILHSVALDLLGLNIWAFQ